MPKKQITARVAVMVEVDIHLENWNENSTVDQVHREGTESAVNRIRELCHRYVRLIGEPKVTAIIAEKGTQ